MKTPDEIKKGLECCGKGLTWDKTCGTGCPYEGMYITGCSMEISADALAYIRQLEAERDAAVEDLETVCGMFSVCHACKDRFWGGDSCRGCVNSNHWQWRGVQKEDTP